MTPFRRCVWVVASCLLALLIVGCDGAEETTDLGAWTLNTEGMTLQEDLRVSETETYYFGSIRAVDVTSKGRIVIADRAASHVKILRPDGSLVDTLGREGEGPGEFRLLTDVQVARGDSVYATANLRGRLAVFSPAPSHALARSVEIGRRGTVWVLERGLLAPHSSRPTDDTPAYHQILRLDGRAGRPDTLFRVRQQDFRYVSLEGGAARGWPIPFSPRSEFAISPNQRRLYHGWTERLRIEAYSLDGSSEEIVSVPTPAIPVRESERDSVLRRIDNRELRGKVSEGIPDTKPAFMDLVVAEDGALWVQRPLKKPSAPTVRWWRLDPETKTIHETRLPRDVEVHVVREGRLYGTTTTGDGAPLLVRYTIQRTN